MQSNVDRIHFMDSMRAVLMMLGVVLHSANVFSPDSNWLISSKYPVAYAEPLVTVIHVFRMPAFFIVSGFFCAMTIGRYGWRKFLRVRTTRIAVPFIATGLSLNSIQTALLVNSGNSVFSLRDYILEGHWVSHLWFLADLIVYFLIAAFLVYAAGRPLVRIGQWLTDVCLRTPTLLVVLLLPVITVAIKGLSSVGFPLYSSLFGVFKVNSILLYSPYFVFGTIVARDSKLLSNFAGLRPIMSLGLIAAAYYAQTSFVSVNNILDKVAIVYLESLIAWLSAALCFYVFKAFLNKQSALWLFMSDASYTVYLFHHIIVVAIGLLLIRFEVAGHVGLPVLVILTLLLSLAIHKYVIRAYQLASYLFNGKSL